jgi:hypothetical protein
LTNFTALLETQWAGYAERHQDRVNLILHVVAVPLFWWGALDAVGSVLFSGLFAAVGGVVLMGFAVFLQGVGLVAEQFVNFPRYVISGAWWRRVNGEVAYGG